MIELTEGCYHVTCRCGHEFCYACGSEWVDQRQTCKCRLWDGPPIMSDTDSDGFDQSDDDFYDDDDEDAESLAFQHQQIATNPFYKTKLCRNYTRGYCWAGIYCKFAHGMHELSLSSACHVNKFACMMKMDFVLSFPKLPYEFF